jgi:hypothetical protein
MEMRRECMERVHEDEERRRGEKTKSDEQTRSLSTSKLVQRGVCVALSRDCCGPAERGARGWWHHGVDIAHIVVAEGHHGAAQFGACRNAYNRA